MLRIVFMFVVAIHGLIHLMGFAKAFGLADMEQLTQDISKSAGFLWLLSSILFILAALAFLLEKDWWWMICVPALVVSQTLIVMSWSDAKFGTLANAIILATAVVGFGVWNFNNLVTKELKTFISSPQLRGNTVSEEMLANKPPLVQEWLRRSKVVGNEAIQTVRLKQTGQMRTASDGNWMPFEAEQWSRTENPGFIWRANVTAAPGIHLAGRDKYEDGHGHMLIKLLSLFPVADAKGKEIDQGTLIRYLGEIIWYPSAALSGHIKWEEVDPKTAKATISFGGITGSGLFRFDLNGDVSGFEARRYYEQKNGATLEEWVVRIDPESYKEFDGMRIPAKAKVLWKLAEGDFTWLTLEISEVQFNGEPDRVRRAE